MNETGSTSKRGNFEGSFKDVDDDVTRESQRQVVTIFLANLRAQRTVSALLSTRRVPFCFVYFFLFFATGKNGTGPLFLLHTYCLTFLFSFSFKSSGNLSFTERAELQRLSSPPPALRYRRSKDDDALRNKRQSQTHSGVTIPLMERDLCPREKVSKARRLFKMIFKELLVDVEAKRTTRIDHDVRMMLKEQNMCVNTDYRVGEVPGILVGDEFEYKTEMSVVSLHFGIMSGIDYMEMSPGLTLATSIAASEGSQYSKILGGERSRTVQVSARNGLTCQRNGLTCHPFHRRSKYDDALRNKRQSQTHSGVTIPLMERDLCPREKVSKARRLFKIIFKELLVDVEAKRTTRIDHDVRMMLKEQNMCVNTDYRVGEVPGILVGDEFEYKTEMSVVGLHFGIMSGIDCQEMRTGLIFATSIVASEGSQYRNVFKGDQLLYSGVGKGLLKGNMALVNNMKHKAPVRVIRGTIHHGNKQMFVYLGLYLVKSYERGAEGCFQFLLETA
ncbi:hypothetical protein HID58_048814 [Brassica napus]|uniref:YDG domain-containing protein n=4 Tax=Brassica TaxID=3705 RepID=A0ABQ8B363_BRANA|nr:hypothetical protein HID58_048814 [Brassica napus]